MTEIPQTAPKPSTIQEGRQLASAPTETQLMGSIYELALKGETEAIRTFVNREKAKEDAPKLGQTMDEYLAELEEQSRMPEPGTRPPVTARRYGEEVLAVLDLLEKRDRRYESEGTPEPPTETEPLELPAVVEPEGEEAEQGIAYPEIVEEVTETGESEVGGTNVSETDEAVDEAEEAEEPVEQPVSPEPPTDSLADADQGDEWPLLPVSTMEEGDEKTSDMESDKEEGPSFVQKLSDRDREIWEQIVQLNEVHKDAEVSEQIQGFEDEFDPERAMRVALLAQASAERREKHGDSPGARQQRRLAGLMMELNEHVVGVGEELSPAA